MLTQEATFKKNQITLVTNSWQVSDLGRSRNNIHHDDKCWWKI